MNKLIITTLTALLSITVMAKPHGGPHRSPPPPQHHHHTAHHHNNTAMWVGLGLGLGSAVVRNVVQPPQPTVVVTPQPTVMVPPPPPKTQIWIPEQRIVTTDAYGRQTVTVIPGHWEYR